MINELKDYERAVYTFQAAKGRYPGDVKNYGTFGANSNYYLPESTSSEIARPGYYYKESDFPSDFITEFRKTAGTNAIPNYHSAPFVELYNEGIIDFKPLGSALTADKNSQDYTKKGTPSLKSEPNAYMYFAYDGSQPTYTGTTPCTKGVENCFYSYGLAHSGQIKEDLTLSYDGSTTTKGFDPKLLKAIDEKMDDGWYSTGKVRGYCYGSYSWGKSSYENAMGRGKRCDGIIYAL